MSLQLIKMSVSVLWVLIAAVIAIVLVDMSWIKALMIAGFGLLPPLAILLLWKEPAQTMTESISNARR